MPLNTTTSTVNVNFQGYLDRNTLERAVPLLTFAKFGQVRPLPENQGTRINFTRFESLANNTTPLVEPETPTGKLLAQTDIYANIYEYGDFVTLSTLLMKTSPHKVMMEASDVLGEQAGESIDLVHRGYLIAGTTVRYASNVSARTSVAAALSLEDINSVLRTLEGNNAKKIKKMVKAGVNISTQGLRPSYIGVTHPDARYDIEQIAGFTPVEKYASQGDVIEGEIGEIKGIRIVLTTSAKVWLAGGAAYGAGGMVAADSTNIDVYSMLVFAENAYGIVPLGRNNIKNIVKKAESSGTSDPLNQRNTSAWWAATTAKILNENFMVRCEFGVSELN